MISILLKHATILSLICTLTSALQWPGEKVPYQKGDLVPVTCLNRTIDTGEHVTDSTGSLQYIPFPTCSETKQPLSFKYLSSKPQNCTITLTDELFHLFEFYIHNDSPMTCRLPILHTSPLKSRAPIVGKGVGETLAETEGSGYVPMVVGLAGQLQSSHLHVANRLNVVIHTGSPATGAAKSKMKTLLGTVDSASAYSTSPMTRNARIIIGDELTFEFVVKWFQGPTLGGDLSGRGSTFLPIVFGAIIGFGACWIMVRGVKLPKSLDRRVGSRSEVLPKYNGYGYGIASSGSGSSNGVVRKGD